MSMDFDPVALHAAADQYVLTPMLRERRMIYTRGEGCRLWDADGNEYLDAVSGTNGVALVGHSHPRVADAVAAQFKQLSSHFLNAASPPLIELARRISETSPTGPAKTYLCPGGGEAVEAALKLAMRITGRTEVISVHGAYHGTGFGGLGLLGLPQVREWLPGGIRWPSFQQAPAADPYRPSVGESGDWRPAARGLEAAIDSGTFNRVAAVILELCQGPGGHVQFPREYVQEVRRITQARGILLIIDEVQTALARSGSMWCCDLYDVKPDIVVIGKAWGGGFPFGAVIADASLITPQIEADPWHILTFQNQPLQAAAALAVLDIVEQEGLIERAASIGRRAHERFTEMAQRHPVIGDVRGPGLFIGVDLVVDRETREPATEACRDALDYGLDIGLLTYFGGAGNVLKFKPPVITSDEDIEAMLDRCEEVIAFVGRAVEAGKTSGRPRPAAVAT
jgi:4-aminobutyrate aminotransferase/4-aminobutyrate aminotransferase/(S)-3-amino-2-methylpropionate transaminase